MATTLFNNRILNVTLGASVQPVIGGGGISGSFYKATGTVTVVSLQLRDNVDGTLLYTIYDVNGVNNQFGDPISLVTGETSVRWNESSKIWEVVIEREIAARGNRNTGEMSIAVIIYSPGYEQHITAFASVPGRVIDEDIDTTRTPLSAVQAEQESLNLIDGKIEGNDTLRS